MNLKDENEKIENDQHHRNHKSFFFKDTVFMKEKRRQSTNDSIVE